MPPNYVGGTPQYITAGNLANIIQQSRWPQSEWPRVYGLILAENRGLWGNPNSFSADTPIPYNTIAPDLGYGLLQTTPRVWSDSFGPKRYAPEKLVDPATNIDIGYQLWSQPGRYGGYQQNWSTYPMLSQYEPYAQRIFGSQSQPQSLGYQQQSPPSHDPSQGIINGVNRFTPPSGGDIKQWSFDQNQGRFFKNSDAGKSYAEIPSYFYDYNSGQWVGQNTATRGQSLPQGAGYGMKQQNQPSYSAGGQGQTVNYGNPSQGSGRQWSRDAQGNWYGASQQYPQQSDARYQAPAPTNQQPFYRGGMAGMQQALGPGGMTLNQLGQSYMNGTFGRMPQQAPPQIPMSNPIMGFGAGRPSLPVSPMGGGMFGYQGGNYSANGLALSRMQSGLF